MHIKNLTLKSFTKVLLEQLKQEGFLYVRIKPYTLEKRIDYIEPHHLILIPIKELPINAGEMEIYEPIDSTILVSWADNEIGVKVMVSCP